MPLAVPIGVMPVLRSSMAVLAASGAMPPSCHSGQLIDTVLPLRSPAAARRLRYAAKPSMKPLAAA